MIRLARLKPWTMPILSAIGIAFALFSLFARPEAEPKKLVATPPASPYQQRVAGLGVVEPRSEVISIGSELAGVVRDVHVQVGDKVSASVPLFTLDTRAVNAEIARLQASLSVAQSQAGDAAAQYAPVRDASATLAIAKDEINRRKFAARTAAARVSELEAQLLEATTTLERLTVKSPIEGDILAVDVRPGEFAPAGQASTPLLRMGDISRLHVRIDIDEENLAKIKPGSPAVGYRRGQPQTPLNLVFVRQEPLVRAKQNLSSAAGQRVDTRVGQLIYAVEENQPIRPLVGEQLDVFMEAAQEAKP